MQRLGHGHRILAAHHSPAVLTLVSNTLRREGFDVLSTTESRTLLRLAREVRSALVLLDVAADGLRVCQEIRRFSNVPIIMIIDAGGTQDVILGLKQGADACIMKPFSTSELLARINALLRRSKALTSATVNYLVSDELSIDFNQGVVTVAGKMVSLSPKEYEVLTLLAGDAGRTCTHRDILTHIWGEAYASNGHVLQMTVGRLRKKIRDSAANPKHIVTRSGIGYLFRKPAPAPGRQAGRATPLAR